MRRRHTGSGRTTVFPPDWQATNAGVIAQTMTATVTIGDPATATTSFNDLTGKTDVVPATAVYTGPASITVLSGSQMLDAVDDPVSTRSYEVKLPVAVAGIRPAWVVHVTSSPDPMLVGRDLTIDTAQLGDRRFSRVLHATLND